MDASTVLKRSASNIACSIPSSENIEKPQEIKHYRSKALANRETIIPWFPHHSLGSLLWRCDVRHYGSAQADIAFEQPTNNPGHHKNNKVV